MSQQRRLRESGQTSRRKTREVWPQEPVGESFQKRGALRLTQCHARSLVREHNSSRNLQGPACLIHAPRSRLSPLPTICQAIFSFKQAESVPALGLLPSSLLLTPFSALLLLLPSPEGCLLSTASPDHLLKQPSPR